MIHFQPTTNLIASAEFTFDNMRSYYQHYAVDWQQATIVQQIASLDNYDIVLADTITERSNTAVDRAEVVGALRLAWADDRCYLRDLQVGQSWQNQGIGAEALHYAKRLAQQAGAQQLCLKVF